MKFRAHKFFAFCQLDSRQATLKSRRTSHRDISICFGLLRWQVMTTFYGEPSSSARCMGAVKHLPETIREICRRWKSKYKTKNNKLEAYRRDEKRAQLAQKRPTTMKSEGIEYDSMGSDHYSDLVKVFRVQLSQVSQRDDLFFFFCCWLYIFHFSLLSALSFHYIIFISLFFRVVTQKPFISHVHCFGSFLWLSSRKGTRELSMRLGYSMPRRDPQNNSIAYQAQREWKLSETSGVAERRKTWKSAAFASASSERRLSPLIARSFITNSNYFFFRSCVFRLGFHEWKKEKKKKHNTAWMAWRVGNRRRRRREMMTTPQSRSQQTRLIVCCCWLFHMIMEFLAAAILREVAKEISYCRRATPVRLWICGRRRRRREKHLESVIEKRNTMAGKCQSWSLLIQLKLIFY